MRNLCMWSETRRPDYLDDVVGHQDVKTRLQSYLSTPPYRQSVVLHGPPGIGKTTLVLAAARSEGFEILEINASQTLRSFADVEQLTQSCRHTHSITSLLRGDRRPMCLILDEIDGSDPHAQRKLVDWLVSPDRKIPVLLTCNEVPRVVKSTPGIEIVRCFPPKPADLARLFPNKDVPTLSKRFKHDVRRLLQFFQYGESDTLPSATMPTESSPEVGHILRQKMWIEKDPMVDAANACAQPSGHSQC